MGTHAYGKYPPEHDFGGVKVLNIGCGFAQWKKPNVTNVDAFDICKPDLVHDINKPFPIADETFDYIIANHILEHLPNWWECLNECARMLKVGGTIEIWVPGSGSDSIRGFRDHVTEINHCSFFGVFGTYRAAGNAWAADNVLCTANRLIMKESTVAMKSFTWLKYAPQSLREWCSQHLRNVNIENGYFLEKIGVEAHTKEMEKFDARVKANYPVSV